MSFEGLRLEEDHEGILCFVYSCICGNETWEPKPQSKKAVYFECDCGRAQQLSANDVKSLLIELNDYP